MPTPVKKRGKTEKVKPVVPEPVLPEVEPKKGLVSQLPNPEYQYTIALYVVTALAFVTRFYLINYPDEVVFDEVHFGKFALYYLERTYFFDLHPPFAKLLIAFVGWLIGYDGLFKFDLIGLNYVANNVPYIAYRSLLALQGLLTVPLIFLTMKTCKYRVTSCVFALLMVLFDNTHVAQTRLILLDATLNVAVALLIYSYVKFSLQRKAPFSFNWWKWLILTGVLLSLVILTKYVGVFTFFMIGLAVAIDLWDLLDYKKGHTLEYFMLHFFARFFSLIVLPFVIYLLWFWIHFAILTRLGPGDAFMSPEFQETLLDLPLAKEAKDVYYYDTITLQHKDTEGWLHSHDAKYPLRYEDGRISSQGQQVTAFKGEEFDANNYWQIIPHKKVSPKGHKVSMGDYIRLYHPATKSFLLTHDVASPYYPTNEEFTTVLEEEAAGDRYNLTLFKLESFDKKAGTLKTKGSIVKVLHVPTVVAMWTHDDKLLPEWGFGQQEVNGNKKIGDSDNLWVFQHIVSMSEDDPRRVYVPKKIKHIPFLRKWFELQKLMFYHNNKLSSEHPFASSPESWPLSLSGVSFWTKNSTREQIYFIGNIVAYWIQVSFLAVYCGLFVADQLTRRRNYNALNETARMRLYYSLGFFFIGWGAHFFPFFLMNRQRFLHHYLPAHLIALMFSGACLEFIFTDNRGPALLTEKENRLSHRKGARFTEINKIGYTVAFILLSSVIVWCFWFFSPLTYGNRGLTVAEVQARKWLDMSLHFAK